MNNPFNLEELRQLNFLDLLKATGCYCEGHTLYYNGDHGNGWIDISKVMKYPAVLDLFTKMQAEFIKTNLPDSSLVVSPAVSGSIVGSQVAKHLNVEFAVTLGKGTEVEYHRRYRPDPNQSVCFVEDLIFSGTDIEANIDFLRKQGFNNITVCCWINRREKEIKGIPVLSLVDSQFKRYSSDSCPLCQQAQPLVYQNVRE